MKMLFVIAFSLVCVSTLGGSSYQRVKIQLTVEPQSIRAGESATLSWKVDNASNVSISGIGKVNSEGSKQVSPLMTTDYTLTAESISEFSFEAVRLTVSGGRGEDEFPNDYSQYKFPVSDDRYVSSLVDFMEQLRKILQDKMKFSVKGPQADGGRFLFVTNRSERGYLTQSDDTQNRIGKRRISYLVEVTPIDATGRKVRCSVKALIEYKKIIESTWRMEHAESIYRTQTDHLLDEIKRLR